MNGSDETRGRDAEETSGERIGAGNARDDEVGFNLAGIPLIGTEIEQFREVEVVAGRVVS